MMPEYEASKHLFLYYQYQGYFVRVKVQTISIRESHICTIIEPYQNHMGSKRLKRFSSAKKFLVF